MLSHPSSGMCTKPRFCPRLCLLCADSAHCAAGSAHCTVGCMFLQIACCDPLLHAGSRINAAALRRQPLCAQHPQGPVLFSKVGVLGAIGAGAHGGGWRRMHMIPRCTLSWTGYLRPGSTSSFLDQHRNACMFACCFDVLLARSSRALAFLFLAFSFFHKKNLNVKNPPKILNLSARRDVRGAPAWKMFEVCLFVCF